MKHFASKFCIFMIVLLLAIIFMTPFYFLVINSFKTLPAISKTAASWPNPWTVNNFGRAWTKMNFPQAFLNSLTVTILSLVGVILFSSMASYQIIRHPSKFNNTFYFLCLAEMIIPFQVIMIPLVVVLKHIGLMNCLPGLIFSNWGLGIAMGIFMFSGFIRNVPKDLEESAMIEGCGQVTIFFKIVFPLLKPIMFTLMILDTFWFWNDYLLPKIIISRPSFRTLPIAISTFMGEYFLQWDLALAALLMSIIPAAIAFLLMQKNIVSGLVAGAVKG